MGCSNLDPTRVLKIIFEGRASRDDRADLTVLLRSSAGLGSYGGALT